MIKIDKPVVMTESEANENYFPNSYIMVQCVRQHKILKGYVVAHAPLGNEALSDYATELNKKGNLGRVVITDTKDPLQGGSLLGEIHYVENTAP